MLSCESLWQEMFYMSYVSKAKMEGGQQVFKFKKGFRLIICSIASLLPVWQYDSVQHPDRPQRKHSSAAEAPAPARRSRPRGCRMDLRCSWTLSFSKQLQLCLGWHSNCGSGGPAWWAAKDCLAGAEWRGEVFSGHRPRRWPGPDCFCWFWGYTVLCFDRVNAAGRQPLLCHYSASSR